MKLITFWKNLESNQRLAAVIFTVYAVLFPLAQLGRQQIGDAVVYFSDILVGVWLLTQYRGVLTFTVKVFDWMKRHPLSWFVAAWAVATLIVGSVLAEQLRPALLSARILAYFLFAGSVGVIFNTKPHFIRWVLLGIGGLIAWLGLLQYIFVPDTRFLMNLGWDDHYYRLLGTFFDPNFAGMALVLASIVTFSLHRRLPRYALAGVLMLFAVCVALTFSRSSYAAFAGALLALLGIPAALPTWQLKEKLALGIVILTSIVLTIVVAPKPGGEGVKLLRTASIEARATATQEYVSQLQPWSMIFGSGLFVQPEEIANRMSTTMPLPEATPMQSVFFTENPTGEVPNHSQVPDNIFITLVSGLGVVGTIGAIALMLIFLHDLARHELIAAIALGSTLIHAQFNNTLFEPFIFQYLLLCILVPLPKLTKLNTGFRKKQSKQR